MRALIAGLGSIGRRHLANLRRLMPDGKIFVWRQHSRDTTIPPGADGVIFSLEDALSLAPEIAVIAGPAPTHVPTGLTLAQAGCALFIEKPLSDVMDGVEELVSLCHSRRIPLMVGYVLRFNPALRAVRNAVADGAVGRILAIRAEIGHYLPVWRPEGDYRTSVSARRELGGGAILELSHELDYVRWIGGKVVAVTAQAGKVSDLEIDVEDTAEILLRFSSRAIGGVSLDMVQRTPVRHCRVVGAEGSATWDGITGEACLYTAGTKRWSSLHPAGEFDRNEMYLAELAAFLEAVRERGEPPVSGEDGQKALEIALAAKQSEMAQRTVMVHI